MSSDIEIPQYNRGFQFDTSRVRYLAYRLLSTFFAEERFATLRTGDFDSPSDIFRSEYVESDIDRFLIEIAIYMRMIDDAANDGRTFFGPWNPCVGTLKVPPDGEPTELLLRDACNKIIHSKERHFRTISKGDFNWNDQLEPIVEFRGEHQSRPWIAEICVQEFCLAVGRLPE